VTNPASMLVRAGIEAFFFTILNLCYFAFFSSPWLNLDNKKPRWPRGEQGWKSFY
jgi:hypothetical protein